MKAVVMVAALYGLFNLSERFLERREASPFPQTGDAIWYGEQRRAPLATLTLYAPPKATAKQFAVRLDDWNTGAPLVMIPVRAGESAVTLVPLGRYRVTIAKGPTWLGSAKLFGRGGEVRESVYPIEFVRNAHGTYGHSVTIEAPRGNMEMKPANRGAL